jgi:hypothetical protein
MTVDSHLKLCQSLETLCLPINGKKDRYWGNDLELPILKRLMLVSQYPFRTFPVLRKLLPGCPSSCDVYFALKKTLDKAYDKDYRGLYDEDDSNEDGSDKDASEEHDEDASEDEGGFINRFPYEEEASLVVFGVWFSVKITSRLTAGLKLRELNNWLVRQTPSNQLLTHFVHQFREPFAS